MAIRGILFDKDGTILDFNATWEACSRRIAERVAGSDGELAQRLLIKGGYDPAARRFVSGSPLAAGTPETLAECYAEIVPVDDLAALARMMQDEFDNAGAGSVLVPGAHQALAFLKPRVRAMGIATNDSELGLQRSMAPHDALHYFDFLAGFDSGHGAKPGPGMLDAFCRAHDLAPTEVAVVGDNAHDLEMGHVGGSGFKVGVLTGTSTRQDLAPYADLVLDSIAGLVEHQGFLAELGR